MKDLVFNGSEKRCHHADFINFLIYKFGFQRYLEIGYFEGETFHNVRCSYKHSVDPFISKETYLSHRQHRWYEEFKAYPHQELYVYDLEEEGFAFRIDMKSPENTFIKIKHESNFIHTSDTFFANLLPGIQYDLIYIDGNHLYDFVQKDISNSLDHISDDGIIVLDDYKLKGWWNDGVTKAIDYFVNKKKIKILDSHNLFNYHHQCILQKLDI